MVKLEMTDKEVETLFKFLDESGDGNIDAKELEDAMRDYRRVMYERKSLVKYLKKNILTKAPPSMSSEKVIDGRLLSPSTLKRQINSLPQLGQHLIHKQWEAEGGGLACNFGPTLTRGNSFISNLPGGSVLDPPPIAMDSEVKKQAAVSLHKANIVDRAKTQHYASGLIARRTNQREVVSRRKAQRELLQSKAGQIPEDAHQKAAEFYEGIYGEVELLVISATNIHMADANGSDGMCKLHFGKRPVQTTSVCWQTLNPIWNETFTYQVSERSERALMNTRAMRSAKICYRRYNLLC